MSEAEIQEMATLVANGVDPQTIAKYRNATSADRKAIDSKAREERNTKEDPRSDGLTGSFPEKGDADH